MRRIGQLDTEAQARLFADYLFVRSIELETGTYEDVILNKYTAVEG